MDGQTRCGRRYRRNLNLWDFREIEVSYRSTPIPVMDPAASSAKVYRKSLLYAFVGIDNQKIRATRPKRVDEDFYGIRAVVVDHVDPGEVEDHGLLASKQVGETVDCHPGRIDQRATKRCRTVIRVAVESHHERRDRQCCLQGLKRRWPVLSILRGASIDMSLSLSGLAR
jgi:hypothetical protein